MYLFFGPLFGEAALLPFSADSLFFFGVNDIFSFCSADAAGPLQLEDEDEDEVDSPKNLILCGVGGDFGGEAEEEEEGFFGDIGGEPSIFWSTELILALAATRTGILRWAA